MIDFRISKQPKTLSLLLSILAVVLLFGPSAFAQQYQFSDHSSRNDRTWSAYNAPRQSPLYGVGFQQQSEIPTTELPNQSYELNVEPNQGELKAESEPEEEAETDEIELEELAKEITALQAKDLPPYTATYDGGFRIKPRDKKKNPCLLYTSPSPRDATLSRMPSSA